MKSRPFITTGTLLLFLFGTVIPSEAQLGSSTAGKSRTSQQAKGARLTAPTAGVSKTGFSMGVLPGGERSVEMGGNPSSITFSNQTGTTVKAYWVDTQGVNKEVGTLFPDQAVQITTYPGHVLVFTTNGQQVAKYKAPATSPTSTAFGIVGSNGRQGAQIPRQSLSLPGNLTGLNSNSSNLRNRNGALNLANVGSFVRSLTSTVPSNQGRLPVTTTNPLSSTGRNNTTATSLANLINTIANNRNNSGGRNNTLNSLLGGSTPNTNNNTGGNAANVANNTATTIASTNSQITPQQAQQLIDLHNRARAEVGLGQVTWDPQVAAFAQTQANRLANANGGLDHTSRPILQSKNYGENLAAGSGFSLIQLADQWYTGEKHLYISGNTIEQTNRGALHYTQMVWRSSTKIGAGVATGSNGRTYLVCNYSPAGNIGPQKPY